MNNHVKVLLLNINIANNRYFSTPRAVCQYYLSGESNSNLLVSHGWISTVMKKDLLQQDNLFSSVRGGGDELYLGLSI